MSLLQSKKKQKSQMKKFFSQLQKL